MTIVFQGHIESMKIGPEGKVALDLYVSRSDGDGGDKSCFTVYSDKETAKNYQPGMAYNCTIYPLPSAPEVVK